MIILMYHIEIINIEERYMSKLSFPSTPEAH